MPKRHFLVTVLIWSEFTGGSLGRPKWRIGGGCTALVCDSFELKIDLAAFKDKLEPSLKFQRKRTTHERGGASANLRKWPNSLLVRKGTFLVWCPQSHFWAFSGFAVRLDRLFGSCLARKRFKNHHFWFEPD